MSISKKHILITGATGGIGSEITEALSEYDVNLILQYFENETRKAELTSHLDGKKAKFKFIKCDLKNEIEMTSMLKSLPSIDIFINSVSAKLEFKDVMEKKWDDVQRHIDIQTKSAFLIIKGIVPHMKEKKYGKIINILSEAVIGRPPEKLSDYIISKYSLLALSRVLAVELGRHNITTNCISPGLTKTELSSVFPSKFFDVASEQTPLKRIAETKDIAHAVKFLCSDESNFINGENILINGGKSIRS
jgi:3-oxoacyl-[acyl-carrier protein] reductase